MNSGPLPPHERSWRHPSEVAAEARAQVLATPPAPGSRKLALGAGVIALGLVVAALLATAASLGVSPAVQMQASTSVIRSPRTLPSLPAEHIDIGRISPASASTQVAADSIPAIAVGDGSLALVTAASLEVDQSVAVIELPNQTVQLADVVVSGTAATNQIAVVRLTYPTSPSPVAHQTPLAIDTVDVVDVTDGTHSFGSYASLSEMALTEGTPVFNLDGELVGLWTDADAGDQPAMIPLTAPRVTKLLESAATPNNLVGGPATNPGSVDVDDDSDVRWSAFGDSTP